MSSLAKDPKYLQKLMAAQQGKLHPLSQEECMQKKIPTLQKAQTLKAFQAAKALSLEAIGNQSAKGTDEIENMINLLV